jgi:predicted nucleotidyltransferase
MMTFRAICFIHCSVGWVVPGDLHSRQRPDGDLDLLIDYDLETKTTFRLMQIEEEISQVLGIPVTITTRDALHPLMKDNIEREVVRVT